MQVENMKRIVDLVVAILLAFPALVLCSLAMVLIRIETSGSPVFAQTRVGRNQMPFTLYKLRTMSAGTQNVGSHEISTGQITRAGAFLRRTKIDELPQIINIFLGNMSLVGPRPCLPNQSELINEREVRGVFSALPGITGSAQVAGIDMSTPKRLAEADATYIATRSLRGDLRLIAQTATGGGRGDAAKSG